MPASADTPAAAHALVLTRLLKAPRHQLFRCWTEPALITQWFTPPPWKTVVADIDVRAGGASLITMQGPDGSLMHNPGQYLAVVPDRLLACARRNSAMKRGPVPRWQHRAPGVSAWSGAGLHRQQGSSPRQQAAPATQQAAPAAKAGTVVLNSATADRAFRNLDFMGTSQIESETSVFSRAVGSGRWAPDGIRPGFNQRRLAVVRR